MSHLVLELRPGEMMVVNGATIRFRSRCRVELVSKARFLFGKQIMAAHEAATTTARLYYALQTVYAGNEAEQADAKKTVQATLDILEREQTTAGSPELAMVKSMIRESDFYTALKTLRAMIRTEQAQTLQPDGVT